MEHLRGDVGGEHLGELVVLEATLQELLLRQAPVVVLVHSEKLEREKLHRYSHFRKRGPLLDKSDSALFFLPFFVCIISSRAQKAPLLVLTSFTDLRFYILAVILKSEWFSKVSLLILLVICS